MVNPGGPQSDSGYGRFEQPPRREGLSTGAKIGIGCGVLVLLVLIAVGTLVVYAQRTFERESGGSKAQLEATETLERLVAEYPFTPPDDGIVQTDQAWKFITVTDEVWREAEPWMEELNDFFRESAREEDRSLVRLVGTGLRSAGKLMRVRVVLAESLERHQVSSEEYAWVGAALVEAYRATADSMGSDVPEANLELARTYETELATIAGSDQMLGKEWILIMAGGAVERQDFWELLDRENFER